MGNLAPKFTHPLVEEALSPITVMKNRGIYENLPTLIPGVWIRPDATLAKENQTYTPEEYARLEKTATPSKVIQTLSQVAMDEAEQMLPEIEAVSSVSSKELGALLKELKPAITGKRIPVTDNKNKNKNNKKSLPQKSKPRPQQPTESTSTKKASKSKKRAS